MDTYETLTEARKLLQLPERATMAQIKFSYRELLRKWHPDNSLHHKETCHEMTRRIIGAFETILAYCSRYQYSFTKEEVSHYLSVEEWWYKQFGNDPLWSGGSPIKPE